MFRRIVLVLIVVVAVGAFAVWIVPSVFDPPAQPDETNVELSTVSVRVSRVGRQDVVSRLEIPGTLVAYRDIAVAPLLSARVNEVFVDIGDAVQKDQVLVALDDEEVSIRLKEAEAAVRLAEANLTRLLAGARPDEIRQLESQVAQAEATVEQASRELDRLRALLESQAISQAQFEQAKTQHAVAESSLQAIRSQLAIAVQGATKEELDAATAQVEQARVGLEMAALAHSYTRVKSPIDGVVAARYIDPGAFAGAGSPALRIVQTDPLIVQAEVVSRDVVHLRVGQAVALRIDSVPGREFPGSIVSVEPTANPHTRLFGVRVEVPNEDQTLKAGMSGRMSITLDRRDGVVAVPTEAVLRDPSGQPFVYVVENDRATRRSVQLGIAADALTEILQGVEPDELVVVSGQAFLDEGSPVAVVGGIGD